MTEPVEAAPRDPDRQEPALFVYEGERLVVAPAADVAVAKGYAAWPDKGPLREGVRLTVMSAKRSYAVGEPVRVIHVVEYTEPGRTVYAMGPKTVYGEHLDGRLVTPPPEDGDPLELLDYDGLTLPSPGVDFNYEITSYGLTPGEHEISWRLGAFRSNTLKVSAAGAGGAGEDDAV